MYLEKLRLDGRIAVVTGGGQAIGLACVEALAEAGAKVVIADYNDKAAESYVDVETLSEPNIVGKGSGKTRKMFVADSRRTIIEETLDKALEAVSKAVLTILLVDV